MARDAFVKSLPPAGAPITTANGRLQGVMECSIAIDANLHNPPVVPVRVAG